MQYSSVLFLSEAGPTASPWPDSLVSSIYITMSSIYITMGFQWRSYSDRLET